jgi:large repetitive protein
MKPVLRFPIYGLIFLTVLISGIASLSADTVSWPVSVAIPTGMVGEMQARPVSVAIPTGMMGEMNSKPVSVAIPTTTIGGVYESRPASVGMQAANLGDPDLVGLWHMDGNWNDSSGNGNHLPASTATFDNNSKGGTQSASFNGSNAFANIPVAPSSLNLTTNFSIEGWVYPKMAQTGGIVDRAQESGGTWEVYFLPEQKICYQHNWNKAQGTESSCTVSGSAPLNSWTHFVAVYSDKKVSIFINGKEDLNATKTLNNNPVISASDWFEIGVNRPGGDEYFNGLIDEVAIYKRALNSDEIAQHYASGISSGNPDAPEAPVVNTVPAFNGTSSIALSGTKPANTSIWVNSKKIVSADSSTTWSGSYTNLQPGTNLLNITAFDEIRLLQSTAVSKTVFYDNIAPTIESSIPSNNSNTAKVVNSVTIVLNDASAGVDLNASVTGATVKNSAGQIISGSWNTVAPKTITFTPSSAFSSDTFTVAIQATDLVGNVAQRQVVFTNHDIGAPVTTATLAGTKDSSGWYSTPVTVTLTANDGADGSGINKIEYSLDNGATWQTFSTPFVISQDGKTTVKFHATDNANNIETINSQEIKINKTGLVGWWKMDGDWKDSSLLSNDGTPYNGTAFSTNAKIGTQAGSFDGVNDGVKIVDTPVFQAMQYMSVGGWIKPGRIASSGTRQSILSFKEGNSPNVGSVLSLPEDAPNKIRYWVQVNGTWQSATGSTIIAANADWYHVAGTYDGNYIKVYVNGVLDGQSLFPGVMTNAAGSDTSTITIGAQASNTVHYYQGLLDDIKIYNRALSATEVMEQYRNISIGVPVVDAVASPVNTPTITLSGSKPANTSIVISNGSASVEIAPQTDAAAWAATTWSGQYTLSPGMNNLNITSKDVDGYHSQPALVNVALDQAAPTVVSSSPIANGILSSTVSSVSISLQDAFSPLDLPATIAQATVKHSSNLDVSGSWATTGSGTTGAAVFTPTTPMGEGTYTISIQPTDSFGNNVTATLVFTVDSTPPVAPGIDPIATVSNLTSRIVTGTKSTDTSRVAVSLAGATIGQVAYPTATTWSVTVSGLTEGTKTISAIANDAAGNQSPATTAGFTVDLTAPAKPIINAIASPTKQTSLTVSGTKESGSYLYVNNSKIAAAYADTSWTSSLAINEGSNTITVFARDEAGNQSQSAQVTVVRDTTPPAISASTPTVNSISGAVNSISITLSGGSSTPDLMASLTGAVVKNSAGTIMPGTWGLSGETIVFTPSATLPEGVYTVTIYPADALGNRGSASFSFTVDQAVPTVQSLVINPSGPLKAATATFSLTFSEAMNTTVQPTVVFGTANYSVIGAWQTNRVWYGSYTLTSAMGDGSYTVTVKNARDIAGNTMADQSVGSFVLDTVAPAQPTVSVVTTPTKTATQMLTGTKPVDSAIAINGTVRVALNSATTWSYSYPLIEGVNTLNIVSRDAAGNDSAAITPAPVITLDTTPPLFTVDVFTNPATSANQTISGKKEAGSIVKMNGTVIFDATDQNTTWSKAITLVDGISNRFTFTVNDAVGNVTTKVIDILFDSAPPTALASGMLVADGSGKGNEVTLSWPSYSEPTALAYYRVFQGTADFATVSGLTAVGTVSKGTKTYKATGLTPGNRTWFAVVPVSTSGNSDSNVFTASAIPSDTLPPENVTSLSAVAGYSAVDGNTVSLVWTASANSIGDLADQMLYVDAGTGYDSGTSLGKTATSFTKKGLNDAVVYKFKITTKDSGGRESSGSVVQAVTRLANPTGLTAIAGNNKAILSWTAVSSSYVKFYNLYRIKNDSAQSDVGGMALIRSQTSTSYTDTGLDNGSTYQYAVTVLNTSGAERNNVQSTAVTPRGDTVGPVLSGVSLSLNQVVTKPTAITVSAADAESTIDRIELYIDEVKVATVQSSSLSWNWNPVDTTDGNHTVKIIAFDSLGNKTESSIPVVVSLAAPAAPVITSSFSAPINQKNTIINGTTQPGVTITLRVNGVVVSSALTVTTTFSFAAVPLNEGDNYISAKASNRGGESGFSADVKVSVVTTAPSAPTTLAAKVQAAGSIQFTWQAGANGAPVGYNLYAGPVGSTSLSDTGVSKTNASLISYLLKDYLPTDDALHSYMVTAVDGAGNESAPSNSVTIAADRVSPTVSEIKFSTGGNTPADNTYAAGQLNIVLTVSEALGETPFLSLEPQSGSPLVVSLRKVDDTHYEGSLTIDASSPQGSTVWKFSAKDLFGNRGNGQGTGPKLDVKGPAATVIAPVTLLKTTAGPVAVSIRLDEASTIAPVVSLTSADNVSAPVTGLTSSDNINWSGTLDPSSLGEGTGRFVMSDSRDRFNNKGTTVAGGSSIILYKVAPPASSVPVGLTAKTFKGREVKLAWKAVTDASGYKIYRQGAGDSSPVPVATISGAATLTATDTPSADGSYAYSISSLGLLDVESAQSAQVAVVTDGTAPPVPTNLSLSLTGNGVKAVWQAGNGEISSYYRIYRSASPISDITGLTAVATVTQLTGNDPSPDASLRYYSVTALDQLGNESVPTSSQEITIPVTPVRNLLLTRVDEGKPSLSWEAGEAGLQGFHIYRNGSRITTTPTLSTTFSDGYYSSGSVIYGVSAVSSMGTESQIREVTLPVINLGLKEGTVLRRGVLENAVITASLPTGSASALTLDSVAIKIGGLPESIENGPFVIPVPGPQSQVPASLEISKVTATEINAQEQTAAVISAIIKPVPGVTTKITRSVTAGVIASGSPLEVFNDPLVRGTQVGVRIKYTNTGSASSEIVTSENSGASSQIRLLLKDQDGNILAQSSMNQRTGSQIVDSGAYATARLNPGESIMSEPIALNIPANAPYKVTLEAQVDSTWFHYKQTDQVKAPGMKNSIDGTIADVSYRAVAQTNKSVYKQGETVAITGTATSTTDAKPMTNVPVKIGISVKGFDRFATVNTDANGAFSYNFTPGASEAGSYSVWAIHPDLADRSVQAQFSIIGLQVSPLQANLRLLKGQSWDIPVTLTNLGGSPLNSLAFETSASSGITATLVNPGSTVLNPGETRGVSFRVSADQNAPESAFASLNISTAEGLTSRVDAAITSTTAIPVIATTPSYIDTGLMRGNQRIENLTIRNTGAGTLANPRIEGPSLPWLALTVDKNIGDIPSGQSRTIGILLKPGETMAQGVYDDRIVIYSDNHIPYTFNIQVTVTSSATGSVQFSVINELLKKVQNATVTLQHQSLPELYYTLKTNADGTAAQFDVPEGRYSYNISAPNHKPYNASFVITPGITTSVPVALEVNLVTVEWSVTPVTIEDRYDIRVTQTFETEVPTSVIVTEPPSIKLPKMEAGQVFNGEFTITNYGLIAADYAGITFPSSFDDYDLEVLAQIPSRLEANQKVVVPYRITKRAQTALNSIAGEITGFGGGSCSGSATITSSWTQVICPGSANQRTKTGTSTATVYWNTCPVSPGSIGGGGQSPITYGGGTGYSSGQGGGGWGGIGGTPTLLGDGEEDECGSDVPRCDSKGGTCPIVCTNSLVNLGTGTYEDSQTDITIKTNGIPVAFERAYASRWTHIGAPPPQWIFVSDLTNGGGCGGPSSAANKKSKQSCGAVFQVPAANFQAPQKFGWTSPWFSKINDFTKYIAYFNGEGQVVYYNKVVTASSGNSSGNVSIEMVRPDQINYVPALGAEKYTAALGLQAIKTTNGFQILDKTGIRKNFDRVRADSWYVLTSIEDTHGKRITFGYDADENLVSVDDATGNRVATLTYANGLLSKITDRDGRVVNYTVDSLGRLVEVTGPQGEKSSFVFDKVNAFNRLLKKTDPEGHVTNIEYLPAQLTVKKVTEPSGATRSFAYDFKGHTFYYTDPRGIVSVYKVNTDGKLTSITRNGVVVKSFSYPNDRSETIIDELGNSTQIQRNEKYDPIRITDAEGNSTGIEYNSYWKVSKITDPLGKITTFDYNSTQDLTVVTDPNGNKTLFDYDAFGNVIKMTRGEGTNPSVTNYEYDNRGNVTKVTDPLGNITNLAYDNYGNLNKITDANNNVTNITNDLVGNPLIVENALGNKRTYGYDKKNNITSLIDEFGRTSAFGYDFKGRITSAIDPLNNKTELKYDGDGNLTEKKQLAGTANERLTTYSYDYQNRLASIIDPLGNITGYDYAGTSSCSSCSAGGGSAAKPGKITDPLGNVTRNLYNRTGKLTSVTDPLGNVTGILRDAIGRPTRKTDANGNITSYNYDSLGRIISQIDAEGGTTEFGYDVRGNLISLKDPKGNTTTFEYDLADRKTKEIRPMGQATDYDYWPNGLLKSVTDAKGQVTVYTYDASNRLAEIAYADATKDTFGYDAAGNMTSYAKPGVSATIEYDQLNRKTKETVTTDGISKTYSYTYDGAGNKQTYTNPESKQYTYSYNKNNQLTQITVDGKNIALDYQWIRQTKTTLPNNVTTDYSYNSNNWLAAIEAKQNANPLTTNGYQFDKVGNITQKTGDNATSYGYDKLYQLTAAGSETFSYDQVGNRNSATVNANNEVTQTPNATYTYDANGNTKTKTVNGQTTTFIYDARDRLASVQLPNGTTAAYTYDPFGRRVKKDVAGVVTYCVYADEGLIGEYAADGSNQKAYLWKPDSVWGTDPLTQITGGNTYYYINDHLGTPQRMVDEQGNVVWSATYSAFGKATVDPVSTIINNLRFPGQYWDEETGLHQNQQRDYDPETGRFTQVDPLGFEADDENLYRYSYGDPVNFFDPDGFRPLLTPDDGGMLRIPIGGGGGGGGSSFMPLRPGGGSVVLPKGSHIPKVKNAAQKGRKAHQECADKVKSKEGWESEPQYYTDPATGKKAVPDIVTPTGRPIELKPNTPSGRRQGARQIKKYERATGKKGRVIYYDP